MLICLWLLCIKLYNISSDTSGSLKVLDGQYSSRLDIAQRSGFVYDRNFNLLSHDRCTGILAVNPAEVADFALTAQNLSEITTVVKQSQITEKLYEGFPFTVSVTDEIRAIELCEIHDGVYYFPKYIENTKNAQHLMGYSNDGKGVTGLRFAYNELLYGRLYGKISGVFYGDAKQRSMSELIIENDLYTSRDGVVTTIDMSLQKYCDSLEEKIVSGCIIIADGDSGEILSLSSFPSYDADNISESLASEKGELVNRAIYSFTPGSVFKIVVSAAALEKDSAYLDYTHNCTGSIQVDDTVFRCHKRDGHGNISMESAFANSCNCYYIALAREIGIDCIRDTCRKTGIDLPCEADFLKEANHCFISDENVTDTYLASIAFGQGDLCLSPLDMIKVVISCTGGQEAKLSLISGEIRNGRMEYADKKENKRIFSHNTTRRLCRMMEECVNSGTGMAAKIEGVKTGGKTATAQTGRNNENGVEIVHKWFCGFYEGIEKRYVFCILCENTPENMLSPCVVASEIFGFLKAKRY